MMDDGLEFLEIHHHSAIAIQAKDLATVAGKGRTDRSRQAKPHLPQTLRCHQALRWSDLQNLVPGEERRSHISYNHLIGLERGVQTIHEAVRVYESILVIMFGAQHRVT